MKVLVTGANGFIGNNIASYLNGKYDIIRSSRDGVNGSEELDLSSDDSVHRFIQRHLTYDVSAIVNTAGLMMSLDLDSSQQFDLLYANIEISRRIVDVARELKVKKIINCSSMAVYPNEDGIYDENSIIKPSANSDCMYGLSKVCSENILDYMLGDDCDIVHLRLSQVYGEGMRKDRIIPSMINALSIDNRIEVFGDGERVSNFVEVRDVCDCIDRFLSWENVSGVYNIGGKNISYMELARIISDKYGNECSEIVKRREGSRSKFYLDTEKYNRLVKAHIQA